FHSFCRGAQAGRFTQLADRDNLWPLLMAITAHKCVDLVRRENRAKRKGPMEAVPDFQELTSQEPSPEFAAQVAEQLDRSLAKLNMTGDPELKQIALAKMDGYSAEEIAAQLGCVRRTVERKLQIIARIWQAEAEGEG